MIILRDTATEEDVGNIVNVVEEFGLRAYFVPGQIVRTLQLIGEEPPDLGSVLKGIKGVAEFIPVEHKYKLVSRQHHPEYQQNGNTRLVNVGGVVFGGKEPVIIAGPCTVYNLEQLLKTAEIAAEAGAKMLRGGAYKPRTNPHSFRGLGEAGLEMLAEARERTGLPFVTEALSVRHVELVASYADMIQIGTRNAQNQDLLEEAGKTGKPVLLKRGYWETIDEWLQTAEWVASTGNTDIVLVERGIRTLSNPLGGRFTLDVQAIGAARQLTYLPVGADPSHAAGDAVLVPGNAMAALAAGAHALEIDIMREDEKPVISYTQNAHELRALYVDYSQGLRPDVFKPLMQKIRELHSAVIPVHSVSS